MPIQFEDALYAVVYDIVDNRFPSDLDDLRARLERFIASQFDAPGGRAQAAYRWVSLGGCALDLADELGHRVDPDGLIALIERKHHDYGTANIARFGRQGLLVRVSDKVARLATLCGGTQPRVGDESVSDTFVDLVGYCAIGVLWERGQYFLPTGCQTP